MNINRTNLKPTVSLRPIQSDLKNESSALSADGFDGSVPQNDESLTFGKLAKAAGAGVGGTVLGAIPVIGGVTHWAGLGEGFGLHPGTDGQKIRSKVSLASNLAGTVALAAGQTTLGLAGLGVSGLLLGGEFLHAALTDQPPKVTR